MTKSSEFTALTLAGAVKKATANYDCRCSFDERTQRRCNDLLLEMSGLSRDATRLSDRASQLKREVESLRRDGAEAFAFGVIAALSGLAIALLRLRRALKLVGKMKKGNLSRDDIIELLGAIPGVAAAVSALLAASKFSEADGLAREAEDLNAQSERLGQRYMAAFNEYDRLGCGKPPDFTGI